MAGNTAIPAAAMEILNKASTGMVIDALLMAGIQGGIVGVRPARGFEDAKVIGPATTVLFAPKRPGTPKINRYGAIRNSAPGSVMVIDGKGIDAHFGGDNVGAYARKQGLVGVVIYGGGRDVIGWREVGMPLWCTGMSVKDKPAELEMAGHDVPVEVGEVLVKPGDIIIADEDGAVCIPANALDKVLENLQAVFGVEEDMAKAIENYATGEEIDAILARKKPKR